MRSAKSWPLNMRGPVIRFALGGRAITVCALSLGLLAAPVKAATYGPPVPVVEAPRTHVYPYEIGPNDTIESLDARLKADTSSAWRTFWIGQGLVATDLVLTCAILSKGGREANPIYGKNANCGRVVAIRGGLSLLQYLLARGSINRDPVRAKKGLQISLAIQGVPVIWNAIQLAK